MNLGGQQTRDRAAGVGIEVETGSLALLEAEEPGAGNHGGVVRRQPGTRREDHSTLWLEPGSHGRGEGTVAGDAATEDDALSRESRRGVVTRGAEQAVFAPRLDIEKKRMSARDQKRAEWRNRVAVLERRGEKVSLHVVNAEERDVPGESERFSIAHTDEQGADESRR